MIIITCHTWVIEITDMRFLIIVLQVDVIVVCVNELGTNIVSSKKMIIDVLLSSLVVINFLVVISIIKVLLSSIFTSIIILVIVIVLNLQLIKSGLLLLEVTHRCMSKGQELVLTWLSICHLTLQSFIDSNAFIL